MTDSVPSPAPASAGSAPEQMAVEALEPVSQAPGQVAPAEAAAEPAPSAVPEEAKAAGEASLPKEGAAQPAGEAAQPAGEATQPAGEATQPAGEATQPAGEATQPVGEATQPAGEATQPAGEATQPAGEATQTAGEAARPAEEGSQTISEATQPPSEAAAAPADGGAGSQLASTGHAAPTEGAAQEAQSDFTTAEVAMPHVKYAQNTIRSLKSRREAGAFLQPVDPIALNVPHYTLVIKEPMDLGTIDLKLALTAHRLKTATGAQNRMSDKLKNAIDSKRIDSEKDYYTHVDQFERDVFRVFDNCKRFNGVEHIFTKNAEVLRSVFEKQRKGLATAVAVAEEQNSPAAKARLNSSSLPTIRRSVGNNRPKREIHPPANRDLPWSEEHLHPASKRAVAQRLGKNGEHLTQRELSYWSKAINDELKFCYRVVDDLLKPAHQDVAWVFYEIPAKDFDWAPAYFAMIKKPIALLPIQRKLKSGGYADLAAFDEDMQLMFRNCFTFNPPDSDVYIMGAKLKDVYEGKMTKRPIPPPLVLEDEDEDEDDEDDEEGDEEDEPNALLVQQLQKQISELEGTLETVENGKNKNPLLVTSTRVALQSVQAALQGALSVAGMAKRGKGKKRSAGAMDKKKGDKKKNGVAKKPRTSNESPSVRKRVAGSDEEDVRTVTFDQKEELAAKITELSDERLEGAIRIINEDKPAGEAGNEDEEIELDIDELSPQTLYKLYKYVVRPKKKSSGPEIGPNGKPMPASAPIDGRKRGTGGLKKKNLDEDEEAARIARLQQQLQQFNDAKDAPKSASPTEPAPPGKHDDLVPSDSSSGEDDESDSDSYSD